MFRISRQLHLEYFYGEGRLTGPRVTLRGIALCEAGLLGAAFFCGSVVWVVGLVLVRLAGPLVFCFRFQGGHVHPKRGPNSTERCT
jgi:hypothetical protein